MKVKVVNMSGLPLPKYETEGSAGMDLLANIHEPITLLPMGRVLIPTGLHMEIPLGLEGQIRGRSGLALNHGITIANGIGTIDSDYRGDIGVILINLGTKPFTINRGDRIAQLVFSKVERVELESTSILGNTERGEGGFGHTGVSQQIIKSSNGQAYVDLGNGEISMLL